MLNTVRAQDEKHMGLVGERLEDPVESYRFNLESFTSSAHFREAQQKEDLF